MNNFEPRKPISPNVIVQEKRPISRQPLPKQKTGRRFLRWTLLILAILVVTTGLAVLVKTIKLTDKIFVGERSSFTKKIVDFFSRGEDAKLIGEDLGQINILLLGIGGANHDGGYLADTIMLAQIRPDLNKAVISSIPRDYLVNLKSYGYRKINASFAEGYARNKNFNEAGQLAAQTVSDITGVQVHYFAVVDFKGFEEAVDLLGGVTVDVPTTFTDYTFPDEKDGYLPAVTFKQGTEQMTGKRALIFARSRHAAGGEGSDFARSQRQQIIMQAVKQKIVDLNLVSDAGKINQLVTVLGDHFHTNIQPAELFHLYNLTKGYGRESIISNNLDPSTKLICPKIQEETGAYVLVPCPGYSANDVRKFFTEAFDRQGPVAEESVIWMGDSTGGKLYSAAEKKLSQAGFTVYKVDYSTKPLEKSVVYAVNDRPKTMKFIEEELNARTVTLPPPGLTIDKAKVDVILILGGDASAVESVTTKPTPSPTPTKATPTPTPTKPTPYPTPYPAPYATPPNLPKTIDIND